MVYFILNRLPKRWRFRAQRYWMHARDLRDSVWAMPPGLMAGQGLITLVCTTLAVLFFRVFGTALLWLALLWLVFLSALAIAKVVTEFFSR